MDSILNTIKKMLGLSDEYVVYDQDIIIDINMVLGTLYQIGLGNDAFVVTGTKETWKDLLGETNKLEMVKTYVYLKVKQLFDPSSNSAMNEAIKNQITELEWRISVQVDPGE